MTEGDDILSRFFSSKSKYVKDDKTQKSVKGIFTRCRMTVKNINKNTSAKILQREWNACRKLPKRPAVYLTQTIRTCKRATVRNQKGHSCTTTVALLQARLGPFSPIFGLKAVSIIFKRLITKLLKTPSKFAYLRPTDCSLQISQAERPKTNK